jgi:hypothetical protein
MQARSTVKLRGLIPITVVLAIATYVIVPEYIRARAEARASQCQNLLFQHSGSHLADVVWLDGNLQVTGVSSCPLCNHPDAELAFVICEAGKEPVYGLTAADIPRATVDRARRQLDSYKAAPRYHALRKSFSTLRDVAMRDRLFQDRQTMRSARTPTATGPLELAVSNPP